MNARLPTPLASSAFAHLCPPWPARGASRRAITAHTRRPEPELLPALLEQARPSPAQAEATRELALRLAEGLRQRAAQPRGGDFKQGLVQALLQEFSLTSQEGIALMCLAEALLRIPDDATRDALIRDKVGAGRWAEHLGGGRSMFVNAAAWGLLITGKLIATHSEQGLGGALQRLTARGGEPLVRRAMDMAMRLMGEQFVSGQDILEALQRARSVEARGFRHSFDMLGEAALTAVDAQRYLRAYTQAIDAIGAAAGGRGVIEGPGISIKLSALHPRYSVAQTQRVMDELYPRLRDLALQAARHDIGLAIDAEEADRLELSLDLLERLCTEPQLAGWQGLGFVVQAYQKRAPALLRHLIGLAQQHHRRLMVRLVKGAYWDSEVKRVQVDGLADYPVYTRKAHTDVAYLACARLLLEAPDAVYPQFATHNSHTLAAIVQIADPQRWAPGQYEFQCLHGMGEPLYDAVVSGQAPGGLQRPCRIYAPVGSHETLLAYLVRRLLENGANSSFVHRIADVNLSLEALVEDPVALVERLATPQAPAGTPHPAIPQPAALYGSRRRNSTGQDLACETTLARLQAELAAAAAQTWQAAPLLARPPQRAADGSPCPTPLRPTPHSRWSTRPTRSTSSAACARPLRRRWTPPCRPPLNSHRSGPPPRPCSAPVPWRPRPMRWKPTRRRCCSCSCGKRARPRPTRRRSCARRWTFCASTPRNCARVGLSKPPNRWAWWWPSARGTSRSPSSLGQVAAALAAGNAVLAKPAEQTPLVAAEAAVALPAPPPALHPATRCSS
jgi:RHH-type proline utilization regulon transcriptional repressor/proline dehydrogenase/delta 1-pyrroline-5-carboxylate dehydrogenase